MSSLALIEAIQSIERSAEDAYLKTWSIITEGAENNGEYSNELLYQVIVNQQDIATDLSHLATALPPLVEHVEKQTGETLPY